MKLTFLFLLGLCSWNSLALGLEKSPTPIKLEFAEHSLTTSFGLLLPSEIIKLEPTNDIKINLPDGTEFKGVVTKTTFKEKYHFECFGEIRNYTNTGFGFVVTKDGIYGAIVMRDTDTIFHVKYSTEANGFVLLRRVTPTIQL